MTDTERERMSEAEKRMQAANDLLIDLIQEEDYERQEIVRDLIDDLAAMTERAEKWMQPSIRIGTKDTSGFPAQYECRIVDIGHSDVGFVVECSDAEHDIDTLRTQLALAEQQRDAAVEGLWKPASEHSDEFEDGDAYLVRIPVIDHRHNREYMEYYIIRASCDSETPLTWNDQHGDHWCEWDWEDVEAYIKLNTLTRIREMGEKEVSHD